MNTIKRKRTNRRPSHPGKILKSIWLKELGQTQDEFAQTLSELTNGKVRPNSMRTKLSEVINGKRAMSADFAVLLGRALNTSARMWMNLQTNLDLWEAEERIAS